MPSPNRPAASNVNGLLIYVGGTLYFLFAAAYDWFGRHDGVKALSDLLGAFIGFFLIWYGRYIWIRIRRTVTGSRNETKAARK